ncbi:aquaporin-like protein [Mycena galopus ATCC 62051]|nr:aquaporin-like protein [Mycena galopus ATCC 62051]
MSMSKAPDGMSNDSGSKDEVHFTEHIDDYAGHDIVTVHPNAWSKYRLALREYVAEFLGVCVLIIFGTGVDCQVVLSSVTGVAPSQKGDYLSINFGWAVGTAMGVWVSGGISGGHINPAVTIALATFRGFPWKKVPGYIAAQTLGGLVGAALVYANYFHAIVGIALQFLLPLLIFPKNLFEGGRHVRTLATASLFSTYALDYMTAVSCFFDEFIGTAVLMVVVLAINDKKNCPPPAGLAPLVRPLCPHSGIGASLGMQTGYAINPRAISVHGTIFIVASEHRSELNSRLLTSMVGYGSQVYTFRNQYWLWCPIIAPILGAQAGSLFYDAFIYTGEESPLNKPNAAARAHHEHAMRTGRRNLPAGPGADDKV